MRPDTPRESPLVTTLSELVSDLGDLFQKELRLAKAEVLATLSQTMRAGVWASAAAIMGVIVLLLIVQAAVFGLIAAGLPPYAACLIIAGIVGLVAVGAVVKARSDASRSLMPERAMRQMKQTAKVAKEQLK